MVASPSKQNIATKPYVREPVNIHSPDSGPQALRLVLHTLATSAARYGRYIEPLLSLSIDFYVRLFVRVHSSPIDVKKVFRCAVTTNIGH